MQIYIDKLILYTLGIFAIALIGALPPLFRRWSDRQLHLFIAFGAGVFLGAIFFHLMPDALAEDGGNRASGMVLVGFLVILMVERALLGRHRIHCEDDCAHRHEMVGITAFIGLSVHSLTAGFGLGVGMAEPELGLVIFIAIIAHKATAAFSLATIFRLAAYSIRKTLTLILLFSIMTPLGALVSLPFIESMKDISLAIPTGLTAGTFLYVATLDLLPEAFHSDKERVSTFIWLIFGVMVMFLIKLGGI
jgi:zinc and cadmium transporter